MLELNNSNITKLNYIYIKKTSTEEADFTHLYLGSHCFSHGPHFHTTMKCDSQRPLTWDHAGNYLAAKVRHVVYVC